MSDNTSISRRTAMFALSQAIILPMGALAAWQTRSASTRGAAQLPALRTDPLQVRPRHDFPQVASDEQLIRVLAKLRLQRGNEPAKINHVDHALRMWGHEVAFDDPKVLDGREMLTSLIDDQQLRSDWGDNVRPLMIDTPQGIRVRTQEGSATASHVDHTLATLTEIGIPLSQEIRTRSGVFRVRDLLHQALRAFSLNQAEYEWTVLALGLYADGAAGFTTQEGQLVNFDRLADRLIRESFGYGVCYGGHRLFTLAMLKRIDQDHHPLLSDQARTTIDRHLSAATQRLYRTQHVEGYWDDAWPGYKPPTKTSLWKQGARLVATGHALEWWAMLGDTSLLPPRETIIRAGQWLVREIDAMDQVTVQKNYTFLTHAGRSLSMWRAELPADSWSRLAEPKSDNQQSDSPHNDASLKTAGVLRLWGDERGFVMSIEFILLAALTIIGSLVGLATYRDAVVQEIGDSAAGVASLSQTFQYDGETQTGTFGTGVSAINYDASVQGSAITDNTDFGETVLDVPGASPLCIQIDASSVEDEG